MGVGWNQSSWEDERAQEAGWDPSPHKNPPAYLKKLKPVTREPWTIDTAVYNAALGTALAALKDVPVENFEFPPGISIPAVDFSIIDNGTKSLVGGAMKFIGSPAIEATASSAADLCSKLAEYVPLDLAKFEIKGYSYENKFY